MIFHEKNVKIVFILFLLHSKCYELLHASRRNNNNEIQYTNILTQKSPPVSIILTGFAVIQLYMNISASIYSQNKENLQIFSDFFHFFRNSSGCNFVKTFSFSKCLDIFSSYSFQFVHFWHLWCHPGPLSNRTGLMKQAKFGKMGSAPPYSKGCSADSEPDYFEETCSGKAKLRNARVRNLLCTLGVTFRVR